MRFRRAISSTLAAVLLAGGLVTATASASSAIIWTYKGSYSTKAQCESAWRAWMLSGKPAKACYSANGRWWFSIPQ